MEHWDAIIAGGGPAGLSAALVLGRCRRKVIVVDSGLPRNRHARELHGYLTRDGVAPSEILRLGRAEAERYGVEFWSGQAVDAQLRPDGLFEIVLASGDRLTGRRLLIATGVVDELPPIPGLSEFYGVTVHHCPYCDGWEHRDQALAVYGRGSSGATFARSLKTWSPDVALCTSGPPELRRDDLARLGREGIPVFSTRIARLEGMEGRLEHIVFENGESLARQALFFSSRQRQRSLLADKLGCKFNEKGTARTGALQTTNVPGLYVAGDAAHDVQFVIVAAAEGAKAAVAINQDLQRLEGRR